jgi:hypothetical protein
VVVTQALSAGCISVLANWAAASITTLISIMAPKPSTNNKSITDFFARAPGLSQTWSHLDSDSDDASGTPTPPASSMKAPVPTHLAEKRDSFIPSAGNMSVAGKTPNSQSSAASHLAFRLSPRSPRTVILPMDGVVPAPSQLQRSTQYQAENVKPSESSRSDLASNSGLSQARPTAKRVIVRGQEVVRGSDEESDDSLELEDLDDILARRKTNNTTTTQTQRAPQTGRVMKRIPEAAKKPADGKLSAQERMQNMRKSVQAAKEAEQRLAELDRKLKTQNTASVSSNRGKFEITKELLVSTGIKAEDDEQVTRTMDAMKRIEALQQEIVWHFFEDMVPSNDPTPFPSKSITNDPWMAPLKSVDSDKIDAAFKSGYILRIAKHRPLPVELQYWMLDEICGDDENDDLVLAYINVLGTAYERFTNHLKPDRLRKLFEMVGARQGAINRSPVVSELQIAETPPRPISPNVRWLVELIRRVAKTLPRSTSEIAIELLVRLAIDNSVMEQVSLRLLIEQTISALISSFHESIAEETLQRISFQLFNSIQHEILRYRVIEALPIVPARAHYFRRHLALAFSLNKTPAYGSSFNNNALYSHVILFLKNSRALQFGPKTDYTLAMAIVMTVDVAIDNGFNVPSISTSGPSPTMPSEDKGPVLKAKPDIFKMKAISKNTVETPDRAFNESVDQLSEVVKSLRDKILTTGATHISRLECRSSLERLSQRLDFAVRTREVKRKDWYGAANDVRTLDSHLVPKKSHPEMSQAGVGAHMDIDD